MSDTVLERWLLVLEASGEAGVLLDREGLVLAANHEARTLIESQGADPAKSNVFDFLPPKAALQLRERMEQNPGSAVHFHDDTQGRIMSYGLTPLPGVLKDRVFVLFFRDVTSPYRLSEALRRERQRHIFLMEALPGLVYLICRDHSIRYANSSFQRLFGGRLAKCFEAIHDRREPCPVCPPFQALDEGRTVEWEWTDRQGRTFHKQASPMIDMDGQAVAMVMGIDISGRKEAEDALRRAHHQLEDRVRERTTDLELANAKLKAEIEERRRTEEKLARAKQKADSAARAKSAFLANMSHEIRTPLNAVLGMAELAQKASSPRERLLYLTRIKEAGGMLLTVINDILDLSKVEARRLTLEEVDFDLRETLSAAMGLHTLAAEDRGLTLELSVNPSVPRFVRGDPARLKQILSNLLANALKFTEKGSVRVEVLPEAAKPPRGRVGVVVRVTDTGIGIASDKLRAIFQSFAQEDDSVTRRFGGTGLGLSICRHLVRRMGGVIGVESAKGRGSVFTFSVRFKPGRRPEPEACRIEQDAPCVLPPLAILLAEDNALNRELALAFLIGQGHATTTVENGAQALKLLARRRFDLVLMDVQMPVLDGLTATRRIRSGAADALDPGIPIVAMTAHALKGDRERFLKAGMDAYVSKPISLAALTRAMHEALSRKQPARAEARHRSRGADPARPAAGPKPAKAPGPARGAARNGVLAGRKQALELLAGNAELLARMDAIYAQEAPTLLSGLREAIEARDTPLAERLAHTVKGNSRTVGATGAGLAAERLEAAAKAAAVERLHDLLASLEREVRKALRALTRLNQPENQRSTP